MNLAVTDSLPDILNDNKVNAILFSCFNESQFIVHETVTTPPPLPPPQQHWTCAWEMKISWVWHHTEVSWVEKRNMGYSENGN